MNEKNSASHFIDKNPTNKENRMSVSEPSNYYHAELKDEIRTEVNELLKKIIGIYIEGCVFDRLRSAASEFAAGKRQLIAVEIGPIRSHPGPVLLIRLEISDFIVTSTGPDTSVLETGNPHQSQSDFNKPSEAT